MVILGFESRQLRHMFNKLKATILKDGHGNEQELSLRNNFTKFVTELEYF